MYPATEQVDATVSGASEKVIAKKLFYFTEHFWIGRRVQAVASIVDVDTTKLKTARIAANRCVSFY